MFGVQPSLEVNGKRHYKTCWGCFVSSIAFVLIFLFLLIKVPDENFLASVDAAMGGDFVYDSELLDFVDNVPGLNQTFQVRYNRTLWTDDPETYKEYEDTGRLIATTLTQKGVLEKPKSSFMKFCDALSYLGGFCISLHYLFGFLASFVNKQFYLATLMEQRFKMHKNSNI
jgi:hypothetical protein